MNPFVVLAEYIKGDIPIQDVFFLMLSEVVGGFLGQLLVFLFYWPHYLAVPDAHQYMDIISINLPKSCVDTSDAYLKAIRDDQSQKLSSCAAEPAIYSPFHNFLAELIGTCMLVTGLNLITVNSESFESQRLSIIQSQGINFHLLKGLNPLVLGFFMVTLIMALGGPTGLSINLARDFGPRLAHFLLPIPGKGSSHFKFSLLINIAGAMGAILGSGIVIAGERIGRII